METMQIDRFGGPEVLHAAEAPEPHAGRGQVRVRVRAIGVNRFDAAVRSGAMEAFFRTPLPAVLGIELAGVVDEVGAGVSELAAGDEIFGLSSGGAYAELAVASVVARKPRGLSWELAASLAVAGETATRVLDALAVQGGETLLVHGGAGVVGSVAVQLARLRGAQVIATGSAANQALLSSLGATPLVYGDGLVARVRALGTPVDAVFDAAGKGALPTRSSCAAARRASSPSPIRPRTSWGSRSRRAPPRCATSPSCGLSPSWRRPAR
jgi:NADPH:quinone reductase-like Zn-dependent oxidoreductase